LADPQLARLPGEASQKVAGLYSERSRQLDQRVGTSHSFAALKLTDCRAVQRGANAQVLLRQTGTPTCRREVVAELLCEPHDSRSKVSAA
jgi:hypothetical protein